MLRFARRPIARALETLAASPGAGVFHCAAGKDRTGVLSAVVLGAARGRRRGHRRGLRLHAPRAAAHPRAAARQRGLPARLHRAAARHAPRGAGDHGGAARPGAPRVGLAAGLRALGRGERGHPRPARRLPAWRRKERKTRFKGVRPLLKSRFRLRGAGGGAGRADTAACQRARFFASGAGRSARKSAAKSKVVRAIASAIVHASPAKKGAAAERRVEELEHVCGARARRCLRHLRGSALHDRLRDRRAVDPHEPDLHHELELEPADPHVDEALLLRRASEDRRRRVERFEIAADRHGLGEVRAVVELEHRDPAERVLREELGAAVRSLHDVDGLGRDVEALLREIDVDAARVRRAGYV